MSGVIRSKLFMIQRRSSMRLFALVSLALGLLIACSADQDGDGFTEAEDCDDADAQISPAADEVCDGADNDCDGLVDDADDGVLSQGMETFYIDSDQDGYGDSASPVVACAAPDGHVANATDCDDEDANAAPDLEEICDGLDNNCDGAIDDETTVDLLLWFWDGDDDGYGINSMSVAQCEPPAGYVSVGDDCDDNNVAIYPGADELCDDLDNDCDTTVDEEAVDATTWFLDEDGDDYGTDANVVVQCDQPDNYAFRDADCDDTDATAYPGAVERCDGVDNDCSGDEAGLAAFEAANGDWTDLTSVMSAGSVSNAATVELLTDGTLYVCAGTWYVNLFLNADVAVVGVDEATLTVLSGAESGRVITAAHADTTVSVVGVTLTEGVGIEAS